MWGGGGGMHMTEQGLVLTNASHDHISICGVGGGGGMYMTEQGLVLTNASHDHISICGVGGGHVHDRAGPRSN